MPPEIRDLIEQPHLLVAVLVAGGLAGMAVERSRQALRRRSWRERKRWSWDHQRQVNGEDRRWASFSRYNPQSRPDAADQLRIVMGAEFTIRPILNKSEARVFKALDQIVISCNPTWQVMAQVSLGEILYCKDAEAYGCINSKRVDLLLMDDACRPRHAIEYQGHAHHQGTSAARDAIKKEALRRAGIGYHEVVAGRTTPAELKRLVERLVDKRTTDFNPAEATSPAPRFP
jgi:hypothetical protein